jgi:hypothetical protein
VSRELGWAGDVQVTSFNGGPRGTCVQLTLPLGQVQLDGLEVEKLHAILTSWLAITPAQPDPIESRAEALETQARVNELLERLRDWNRRNGYGS